MRKSVFAMMAAVSVLALSANANANEYNPYVGAAYNYSDVSAKSYKPYYNSGTFYIGTSYNKYFGTEVFYQYSDDHKKSFGGSKVETSLQSYGLDVYGYLPLFCDPAFAFVGTAGIAQYDIDKKISGEGSHNDNGWGYRIGVGAQYSFNSNWDIRGVVRHVEFDKIDSYDHMIEYTLGVKYNF